MKCKTILESTFLHYPTNKLIGNNYFSSYISCYI